MPEEKIEELKGREANVEALSAEDLDKVSGGSFSVGPGAATGFFGGCCLVRDSHGTLQYWIAPPHEMYGDLHWAEVDAETFHNYYLLLRITFPEDEAIGYNHQATFQFYP